MTLFQLSILGALAASLFVGFLAIHRQMQRPTNRAFFVLTLVLTAWLGALGASTLAHDESTLEFWVRQSCFVSILCLPLLDLLRAAVLHPMRSIGRLIRQGWLWLVISAAIGILCQSSLFLTGVSMPVPGESVARPAYGPGFVVYDVFFAAAAIYLFVRFIRSSRAASGIKRAELQFILLGGVGGLVTGLVLQIAANVTGIAEISAFMPLGVVVLAGAISYGIVTRRIMDVSHVLRRMVAYALLTIYLLGLYVVVLYGGRELIGNLIDTAIPLPEIIAVLAVAFSMAPAQGWMQRFASLLFVNVPTVDISRTLELASRELHSITQMDQLVQRFAQLVAQAVNAEHVSVLLREGDVFRRRFPITDDSTDGDIAQDAPLSVTLQRSRDPLVYEMIARERPRPMLTEAGNFMRERDASVAVGIYSMARMDGIVLLGRRMTGRIYGLTDIRVLQLLGDRFSAAMENVRLYAQVQDTAIYNQILLENLVSGVVACNKDRVTTVFNREAQRITGLAPELVLQRSIDVLPKLLRDSLIATLEGGEETRNNEGELEVGSPPQSMVIRFGSTLFRGHAGNVLGSLLVFVDLTDIKKLEHQVRRTDRLASLGTLAAGMAHEIKNPLVTLKTFAQLLPERFDDPDFRGSYASLLGDEVKRIDSLVNQLLRFARPVKPSLVPMHLHATIQHIVRLLGQQMKQRNIGLSMDLAAASDLILGDHDMLVQALLNFVLNAIEAMDEGGMLTIRTKVVEKDTAQLTLAGHADTQGWIQLCICDTGSGIRPEDVPHVFDPFFTTKSSGTGLGLSVAHGIIVEHKGVIDVESTPGEGTTIRVQFLLS